jgi:hypothetical protein
MNIVIPEFLDSTFPQILEVLTGSEAKESVSGMC